jgi:hypothetical protein
MVSSLADHVFRRGPSFTKGDLHMRAMCLTFGALLLQLCSACVLADMSAARARRDRVLTVADGIEGTRAMVDADNRSVFPSPDGQHYVTMLIRGDLRADGVWAEIVAGRVAVGTEAQPRRVARFFTKGLGPSRGFALYGSTALTMPQANVPVWLDNARIAILWEDAQRVIQVVSLNVLNGEQSYLTQSATDVLGFTVSPSGAVIYDALSVRSKEKSERLLRDGFTVTSVDALPLVAGYVDGSSMFDFMNCDRFVLLSGNKKPQRIELASPFHCGSGSFLTLRAASSAPLFSPDGSRFLVNGLVTIVPEDWSEYTNVVFKNWLKEHAVNPKGLAARLVQQLVVVDMRTGASRHLWSVPHNTAEELRVAWSQDGQSILLGPTFMDASRADAAGLQGRAVCEIEVESGRAWSVPIAADLTQRISEIRFAAPGRAEIDLDHGRSLLYEKSGDEWRLVSDGPSKSQSKNVSREKVSNTPRIEMRQDMNTRPALYSIDGVTGRQEMLLDLNPWLDGVKLGRVEFIRWTDANRRQWRGRLYYPANYTEGRKYPLVIQARCYAAESEFSLYGCGDQYPTVGPGWSVFLAQALAGQDIAVLQLSAPIGGMDYDADATGASEPLEWRIQRTSAAGWQAAAEHLIEKGLVHPDAVGVMGFSLTGWVLEYVLSHSKFPFAAAVASDHGTMGYMQAALSGWPVGPSNAAGAAPFGDGLKAWLENAPVFNLEDVHTPLQLQLTSSGEGLTNLLWHWEMYSRLRYLRKPVEYYVAPDVQHGSHTLQNPRQLAALQERTLDWWRFWLKGEERGGGDSEDKYKAWRELRRLHEADLRAKEMSFSPADLAHPAQ